MKIALDALLLHTLLSGFESRDASDGDQFDSTVFLPVGVTSLNSDDWRRSSVQSSRVNGSLPSTASSSRPSLSTKSPSRLANLRRLGGPMFTGVIGGGVLGRKSHEDESTESIETDIGPLSCLRWELAARGLLLRRGGGGGGGGRTPQPDADPATSPGGEPEDDAVVDGDIEHVVVESHRFLPEPPPAGGVDWGDGDAGTSSRGSNAEGARPGSVSRETGGGGGGIVAMVDRLSSLSFQLPGWTGEGRTRGRGFFAFCDEGRAAANKTVRARLRRSRRYPASKKGQMNSLASA